VGTFPVGPRAGTAGRIAATALVLSILVPTATPAVPVGPVPYRIGVEDRLRVALPGNPELTSIVIVQPGGRISLPLIDDMPAAGLTPRQLKLRLVEAYRQFIPDPQLSVIVEEIHSLKIYVMGKVVEPGVLDPGGSVRLLEAIALAGGVTRLAEKDRVLVLRDEGEAPERLEVNLKRIYSGEDLGANLFLQPGDTVVVP
jgi:polysaccharide export outer membrane protein